MLAQEFKKHPFLEVLVIKELAQNTVKKTRENIKEFRKPRFNPYRRTLSPEEEWQAIRDSWHDYLLGVGRWQRRDILAEAATVAGKRLVALYNFLPHP